MKWGGRGFALLLAMSIDEDGFVLEEELRMNSKKGGRVQFCGCGICIGFGVICSCTYLESSS